MCAELAKFVDVTRANVELNFEAGVHDRETRDKFERDVAAPRRTVRSRPSCRDAPASGRRGGSTRRPLPSFPTRRGGRPGANSMSASSPRSTRPRPVNGIGRVVHSLATGLARRGHVVRVLTTGEGHPRVDLEDDVWVHRMPVHSTRALRTGSWCPPTSGTTPPPWSTSCTGLRKIRPIDIVQCPNWDSEGIAAVLERHFRTVIGLYTPLRTALRVDPAMQRHADAAPDLFAQLLAVESLVYEQADGFLACGPAIVEEVEAAYGVTFDRPHRSGWSPTASLTRRSVTEPAPGSDPPRILFVGRLEARKGIDTLLDAATVLANAGTAFELHIVGDDSLVGPSGRTYREDFERAHPELTETVRFLGRIDDEALRHEYSTCDVFVAPSRFESFGLILLEAMMFAKPVVSSDIGGMTEIIRDGVSGFLVPPDDVDALAGALARLVELPGAAGDRGARRAGGVRGLFHGGAHGRGGRALLRSVGAGPDGGLTESLAVGDVHAAGERSVRGGWSCR